MPVVAGAARPVPAARHALPRTPWDERHSGEVSAHTRGRLSGVDGQASPDADARDGVEAASTVACRGRSSLADRGRTEEVVMNLVSYDVTASGARNRVTVAFRLILLIPHAIVMQVWGYFAQILGVVQWFVVLFTGTRNEGIWRLQDQWLGYSSRVWGYGALLHDVFPPFGPDPNGAVPSRYAFEYAGPANRLTNGLRLIWVLPAAILAALIGIAAEVLAIISWFAIVITGSQPQGMFDFIQKAVRYGLRVQSYALLMTDTYPKYE
jgi:hypothetical protein